MAVTQPSPTTNQPRSQSLATALRHLKFAIPALPRGALVRTELMHTVRSALFDSDSAVTLISAPAGSGKTTLLSAIATERAPGSVAWCTLDARDNDPVRFSRSILEAVLTSGSPDIVSRAAAGGRGAQDPLEEALLVAACSGEMLLVLDEAEYLQTERANAALRRLITQTPPNVSLVVLTKRTLMLDRQTRQTTLRGPQLDFSLEELRALFAQRHVTTSDDELLFAWTHGLAAAVALAATAYADPRTRDRIVRAALRGDTTPYIAIYDTLVDCLDADTRDMLIASSVADPVSGDLGEALIGDSRARSMITELARSGLYLDAIPGCADWYRHRYPSRNLLRARLVHERPDDVARLHSSAARWFQSHGDLDRAIDAAVLGDDAMLAYDLVRERWTESAIDDVDSGLARISAVPNDATDPSSFEASLTAAAIALEHGDTEPAIAFVERWTTDDLFVARSKEWDLFARLLALRVARDTADSDAIRAQCGGVAMWIDSSGGSADSAPDLHCLANRALAEAALIDGDLDGAGDLIERVYREATVTGREQQMVAATASWALVTALAGRVRQAGALIDEVGDASSSSSAWSKGVCCVARGVHEYHADNPLAANAAASEARALLRDGVHGAVVLPMLRARLKASIGDDAGASRLRARASANATPELLGVLGEALGLAPVSTLDSKAAFDDVPSGSQHPYACARRSLRNAHQSYEEQRWDDAWSSLDHALALVDRHRFQRIALDSGADLRPVLRDYIAQAGTYTPLAWRLLQRLPTLRDGDSGPNVETLTDRELAVLRQLPSMKSNQEIAAEMYFSVNTIKTHLKSIYRKLGVNRRRDAVEEARARSLL